LQTCFFVIALRSACSDRTLGARGTQRDEDQEMPERTSCSTALTCMKYACTLENTSTFFASVAVIELSKRGLCLDRKGMKPPIFSGDRVDGSRYVCYTTMLGFAMVWSGPRRTNAHSDRMRRACLGLSAPLHRLTARHLHAFHKRRAQRRLFLQTIGKLPVTGCPAAASWLVSR
jgi:hypothetical protein